MAGVIAGATLLVAVLLILGPHIQEWVGEALAIEGLLSWAWWIAQWPLLAVGLLAAFATLLYFGPDVDQRRWRFVTPGSLIALVVWLLASGGFALYTNYFGSYNKTWGSLSAVIVTLTWLWLTALALLFGGELNAEVERAARASSDDPNCPAHHGPMRVAAVDERPPLHAELPRSARPRRRRPSGGSRLRREDARCGTRSDRGRRTCTSRPRDLDRLPADGLQRDRLPRPTFSALQLAPEVPTSRGGVALGRQRIDGERSRIEVACGSQTNR